MDLRLKFKTKFKGKQNVKFELFMLPHLGTLHLRRLLLSDLLLYSQTKQQVRLTISFTKWKFFFQRAGPFLIGFGRKALMRINACWLK